MPQEVIFLLMVCIGSVVLIVGGFWLYINWKFFRMIRWLGMDLLHIRQRFSNGQFEEFIYDVDRTFVDKGVLLCYRLRTATHSLIDREILASSYAEPFLVQLDHIIDRPDASEDLGLIGDDYFLGLPPDALGELSPLLQEMLELTHWYEWYLSTIRARVARNMTTGP